VTVANVRRECPTCGTTYGTPVDGKPERCGVCITGLSLDGRPVRAVAGGDGIMRCSLCLSNGSSCELEPHDEWPGAWQHVINWPPSAGDIGSQEADRG
jgi:hypothetical protein